MRQFSKANSLIGILFRSWLGETKNTTNHVDLKKTVENSEEKFKHFFRFLKGEFSLITKKQADLLSTKKKHELQTFTRTLQERKAFSIFDFSTLLSHLLSGYRQNAASIKQQTTIETQSACDNIKSNSIENTKNSINELEQSTYIKCQHELDRKKQKFNEHCQTHVEHSEQTLREIEQLMQSTRTQFEREMTSKERKFHETCKTQVKLSGQELQSQLKNSSGTLIEKTIQKPILELATLMDQKNTKLLIYFALLLMFIMLLHQATTFDLESLEKQLSTLKEKFRVSEAADTSEKTIKLMQEEIKSVEKRLNDLQALKKSVDQLEKTTQAQRIEFLDMRIHQNWSNTPVIGWFLPNKQYLADIEERDQLLSLNK